MTKSSMSISASGEINWIGDESPKIFNCSEEIRRYQNLLGLSDWDISLEAVDDEESYGEVYVEPEYKRATIYLNMDQSSVEDIQGTIRHELIHIILWEMSHAADYLTKTAAEREWLRMAEERAVTILDSAPFWSKIGDK